MICRFVNVYNNNALRNVFKGIYLMVAVEAENTANLVYFEHKNLYRFGIIGESDKHNNALKRLSQANSGWRKNKDFNFKNKGYKWKYVIVLRFARNLSSDTLILFESIIRKFFFEKNKKLLKRLESKDAFLSNSSFKIVSKNFKDVLHENYQLKIHN